MGSYPRSYGPRFQWGGMIAPGIKALIIASTAVFLVQTLIGLVLGPEPYRLFNGILGLVPFRVLLRFWIWQPFTYLFLHGHIFHLLFNMLFLWMFGNDIERQWGRRRFLFYYFLCGVGAGLIDVLARAAFYPASSPAFVVPTIGASGAVYGILLAAAVLYPDRQVMLFPFPVLVPMRVYVLIIGAIAFFGALGTNDNISHVCHLGGIGVGYAYLRRGSFFYRIRNRYSDWQKRRLRRRFEVYVRDHKDDRPSRPDSWVH